MSWIFFAIAGPALYAVTNFIDKFIIEKHLDDPIVLTMVGGGISFIFGIIILALRGFPFIGWEPVILVILSGALVELALLPYYKAMNMDDTSRVTPLFQVVPIFVLILSYIFLKEDLGKGQLLGFLFVLIGGFLLSLKRLDIRIFSLRESFCYMMLASIFYAIATILFKFVTTPSTFWDLISYELIGGSIVVAILFFIPNYRKRSLQVFKTATGSLWGTFITNESVYLVGRLLGFYAFALASAPLVAVMGGFQPLFVLIYGLVLSWWFPKILKEDTQGSTVALKLVSIVFIFIGLWFINF